MKLELPQQCTKRIDDTFEATNGAFTSAFEAYHLRCDGSNLEEVHNPSTAFAIDNPRPRFTWAARHHERGQRQTAYRVVLKEHRRDRAFDALPLVFDSGRVPSAHPSHEYRGEAVLRSDTVYVWQVVLWDANGQQSTPSSTASFRFALADQTDWEGVAWVSGNNRMNNNLLRSTFNVTDPASVQVCSLSNSCCMAFIATLSDITCETGLHALLTDTYPEQSATIYVCGLSYSNVRINGQPASNQLLTTSAWTNNEKRNTYSTLDVTHFLAKGSNAVGVVLGHGAPAFCVNPNSPDHTHDHLAYNSPDHTHDNLAYNSPFVSKCCSRNRPHNCSPGWRDQRPDHMHGNEPVFKRKDAAFAADKSPERVLRLQVRLRFASGETSRPLYTGDGSWKGTAGPIIYDAVYNGETYDARREQPGWDLPHFDTNAPDQSQPWMAVVPVAGPPGPMRAWAAPAVVEDRAIKPVNISVVASSAGKVFVVDFGVNVAGVCRLSNIRIHAGANITLRHGEILQHRGLPDLNPATLDTKRIYVGNLRGAKATDVYVAKGDAAGESFQPSLTYHGFRFVEVTCTDPSFDLRPSDIELVHLHSAIAPRARVHFNQSDTLNVIQRLAIGAQRSNAMTVPTDCDQRDERLGWTGDADLSSDSICLNFHCGPFLASFADTMADEMGDASNPPVGSLTDGIFIDFAFKIVVWNTTATHQAYIPSCDPLPVHPLHCEYFLVSSPHMHHLTHHTHM